MNKTNKSILKRVKITGTKKVLRRKTKQNHFNAKETGSQTRGKRLTVPVKAVNKKFYQAISRSL